MLFRCKLRWCYVIKIRLLKNKLSSHSNLVSLVGARWRVNFREWLLVTFQPPFRVSWGNVGWFLFRSFVIFVSIWGTWLVHNFSVVILNTRQIARPRLNGLLAKIIDLGLLVCVNGLPSSSCFSVKRSLFRSFEFLGQYVCHRLKRRPKQLV